MKGQPSEFLLKLLTDNGINGCLVLLQEQPGGGVKISHAEDNIHTINIIQSLAVIIDSEEGKRPESEWTKLIQASARAIIHACNIIKDIADEEDDKTY